MISLAGRIASAVDAATTARPSGTVTLAGRMGTGARAHAIACAPRTGASTKGGRILTSARSVIAKLPIEVMKCGLAAAGAHEATPASRPTKRGMKAGTL